MPTPDAEAEPPLILPQDLADQPDKAPGSPHAWDSGDSVARDRAMWQACRTTGCIVTIDAALRDGASVGTLPIEGCKDATMRVLTLYLAAKGGHVEAFRHLLSLGARIDEPGATIASVKGLVKLATAGRHASELLPLFLGSAGGASATLFSQISQKLRDEAFLCVLEAWAPRHPSPTLAMNQYVDVARQLLDAGASPDSCRAGDGRIAPTSALSIAVLAHSRQLLQLLLDRGAHINGPPALGCQVVPSSTSYVPLCAAVHRIATTTVSDGSRRQCLMQMTRLLLDRGADANQCVPVLIKGPVPFWYYIGSISFTSPLLVFLDNVLSWDDDQGGQEALEFLKLLLAHGASPTGPGWHPARVRFCKRLNIYSYHYSDPGVLWGGRWGRWPEVDVIRDLLDKWTVQKFESPAFASAMELLAGYPSRASQDVDKLAQTLISYDYTVESPKNNTQKDVIISGWRRMIGSIARRLGHPELDRFLHAYATLKCTCPKRPHHINDETYVSSHRSSSHPIGDLAMATVSTVLAAGANINYRVQLYGDKDNDGGQTVLHDICVWLAGRWNGERCYWRNERLYRRLPCEGPRVWPHRARFIRFLVDECGADVRLRHKGRTPVEILVELKREASISRELEECRCSDPGKHLLEWQRLIDFLKDAAGREESPH